MNGAKATTIHHNRPDILPSYGVLELLKYVGHICESLFREDLAGLAVRAGELVKEFMELMAVHAMTSLVTAEDLAKVLKVFSAINKCTVCTVGIVGVTNGKKPMTWPSNSHKPHWAYAAHQLGLCKHIYSNDQSTLCSTMRRYHCLPLAV
jgi:hypothetical protein